MTGATSPSRRRPRARPLNVPGSPAGPRLADRRRPLQAGRPAPTVRFPPRPVVFGQHLCPRNPVQPGLPVFGITGLLCRVESLAVPAAGSAEVAITWIEDRGYLNGAAYVVPADDPITPATYEPSALDGLLVPEMPWGWAREERPLVLILPARGTASATASASGPRSAPIPFRCWGPDAVLCPRHPQRRLPCHRPLVDDEVGLDVTLVSRTSPWPT